MRKLRATVIGAATAAVPVWFIATPGSAMPFSAHAFSAHAMKTDWPVENARLVCDEFGRCWQTQPNFYNPRASQPYSYGPAYPYSGYAYGSGVRPQGKWERKGFCPPGQRKKGNC